MTCAAQMPVPEDPAVNHEFINCLTSVKCLTDLLVAYPGLDTDDRNLFLTLMQKETQRLVRLSDHIKQVSNIVGSS